MTDSQDKLSQADKDKLAIFAGLHIETTPGGNRHWFDGQTMICGYADWNPLLPEHGWLVLKALVEKRPEQPKAHAWLMVFDMFRDMATAVYAKGEPFDFWLAVMLAALATRKDGG